MFRKTFLERMSMLSLNKSKKDSKKEEIPQSQDAFNSGEINEQLDLSLPVTNIDKVKMNEEDKTSDDFTNEVSAAVRELRTNLENRLSLAKAREGLAYALEEEGNLPPFCKIVMVCRPELNNKTVFNELRDMWQAKERSIKEKIVRESVTLLDKKLADYNRDITEKYNNTMTIIGVATAGAGEARKQLKRRFLDIKENTERELTEFKTDIRSKKETPSWRRGRGGRMNQVKYRGKPY